MVKLLTLAILLLAASLPTSLAFRVSHKGTAQQADSSLIDQGDHTEYADGCHKNLVVEWSYGRNVHDVVPGPHPLLAQSAFSIQNWTRTNLFEKSLGAEPGCKKEYTAQCQTGAVHVQETCNGEPVETGLSQRCLVGLFCLKGDLRRTSVRIGDKLVLNVPKLSGGTCKVTLRNGAYVKYYSWPADSLVQIPDGKDLAEVAAAAAKMSDGDECGQAAMHIHEDAGNAARTLSLLAGAARAQADRADDPLAQAFHGLNELHFEKRRVQFETGKPESRATIIETLADDSRKIKSFAEGSVNPEVRGDDDDDNDDTTGMVALSQYYRGLANFPPHGGKRRALILTCSFGGGHKSAASAVAGYLKTAGFDTHTIDTTYDENFYDRANQFAAHFFNEWIIKRQNYNLFNVMDFMQQLMGTLSKPCRSPGCDTVRKQQFRRAMLEQRPDIVVTVYHMELLTVMELAKELGNLPVLHIATDMDIKVKEIFNDRLRPIYPKFLTGVPFNLEESYETIAPFTRNQTFLSGYPVRGAFLKPFDKAYVAAEKAKFVPEGTKLMLIMTGGGGQDVQWPYKLAEQGIGMPLHVVIIAGGNNALAAKMRASMPSDKIFPDGRVVWHGKDDSVTVEVAKDPANTREDKPYYVFEDRLALLMDMADVMLSKPGGGSTAEIAYRGVPSIYDTSEGLFHWERFTVNVFEHAKRGIAFHDEDGFRPALLKAMDLGRSQSLAEDVDGQIINTKDRVVAAAETLLAKPCKGCHIMA